MGNDIDQQKVNDKFGPPSYLETLLADIGTKKGKINEGLNSFLTLPYVNALKVKDRAGKDISLYQQVLTLKTKYEGLQERSVPIVGEISAYGRLSKALLPLLGKSDQMTLDQFLQINTGLVMKYGKTAKGLAKETNDLKKEFTDLLDLLETNLGEVVKKIAEQEHALHEAEKEYAFEKANAIISGVIALCFLIGAGVALCMGAVPVALELGAHAGIALYETIKDAIKASDLAGVISNLKAGIESAKKTKTQLEALIPKFTEIVGMFDEIGKAWDNMTEGLAEVKDNYLAWSNPKLFTPEMLTMTLESWNTVTTAAELYISIITGAKPADTTSSHPSKLMVRVATSAVAVQGGTLPDAKTMAAAAGAAIQDVSRQTCREIFSAPLVTGTFPRPSDLQNIVNEYSGAANTLRNSGSGDMAERCDNIVQAVSNNVMPLQVNALDALRKFAERQPEIPSLPLQEDEWEKFCAIRMGSLQDGKSKVDQCYSGIHNVQNMTSNLFDNLTARVLELHITLDNVDRKIREAEEEKRRMISHAFGGLIPGLDELIDRITGMCEERSRRSAEMGHFKRSTDETEICLQRVKTLGNSTATIDSMWNTMQTGMVSATTTWPVLHTLKLSDLEIDLYRETWAAVRSAIGA